MQSCNALSSFNNPKRKKKCSTHLDDVAFLETELVCFCCREGEESHGLHPEERCPLWKVSLHEWRETEASSVIGGQHCDRTWLRDDIISVCVCRWESTDILLISLMRASPCMCAPVLPCEGEHVDVMIALTDAVRLWSFNEDFSLRGNNWQQKNGNSPEKNYGHLGISSISCI